VVTERGMGKCSPIDEYRVQRRGGKGIITVHRTEKTGVAVSIKEVLPDDELMLITKGGVAIRMPVKGIRVSGRNTQGVKLVNLDANDLVMDVARVVQEDEGEGSGEEPTEPVTVAPDDDDVSARDGSRHPRRHRGSGADARSGRRPNPVAPLRRARGTRRRAGVREAGDAPARRRVQVPGCIHFFGAARAGRARAGCRR